ncbi:hypothetical protein HMPREF9005_2260, partial [Actinomyces sp. oral taxon 178 str. F0338]
APGGTPAPAPGGTPAPGPGPGPAPLRVTHTRTLIYATRTAHKGLIPPLCAVLCCLIPSLVCGTGGKRTPMGDEGRALSDPPRAA